MAETSKPARIWYQSFVHPTEQAPYMERLQAFLNEAAGPGVKFEVHGLDPPDRHFHPLTEFRCAAQTIRNAIEAERAGYDAFVIGHFQEPGLLEMTDDERVVAAALSFERIADGLCRAAKFGQRMKVAVGRIEAMNFKLDARTSGLVEKCLQSLDVRRLLGRVNEALVPNTDRTGWLGHVRFPYGFTIRVAMA